MRICVLFLSLALVMPAVGQGQKQLFDNDWKFHRGDVSDAYQSHFDDSKWRSLDLPHDWSIEDLPGKTSPFDQHAVGGVNTGFTVGGIGWYRKSFHMPTENRNKKIYIMFEGVYMNSDFWINGQHVGTYPYGYSSFWFDITDKIKFNENNIIAVQVKNEGKNSRWYSGSGIYRHVWLRLAEPVHIDNWGIFITTPDISEENAQVNVKTKVVNGGDQSKSITLTTTILNQKGEKVGETTEILKTTTKESNEFNQTLNVKKPNLWSPESPSLYKAISEIYVDNKLMDRSETTFGIRSISFNAEQGFKLNGKQVLLKGACVHHDNGPLGAKAYDRAEERKVELLKASGFNAIRTAHNPPSPAFLEACDRLGMLVIDEAFDTWKEPKNKQDYNLYFNEWWQTDIRNMILRDRNHPSIIMWSTGNEIPNRHKPEVAEVSKMLSEYVRSIDSTRPVTSGVNGVGEDKDLLFSTMDIAGYNYAPEKYKTSHLRVPNRVMYGSESFPIEALDYWEEVEKHPYVIGDFVWTAFDYIGEASIGWLGYPQSRDFFPWNLAYCGDIDICGWKRPQSYYRDAVWNSEPVLSIYVKPPVPTFKQTNPEKAAWSKWDWPDVVANWTWPSYENEPLEVVIYSNNEEVELFLNDKSLGKKGAGRANDLKATWQVPYQKGSLKAIGYQNGKKTSISELKTAGEPAKIRLTADRNTIIANNQDLSYVTVELVDSNGNRIPQAENLVKLKIEGNGSLIAVGNANPTSLESYTMPQRKLWQGRALAIIKGSSETGKITLTAETEGLPPAAITINVTKDKT